MDETNEAAVFARLHQLSAAPLASVIYGLDVYTGEQEFAVPFYEDTCLLKDVSAWPGFRASYYRYARVSESAETCGRYLFVNRMCVLSDDAQNELETASIRATVVWTTGDILDRVFKRVTYNGRKRTIVRYDTDMDSMPQWQRNHCVAVWRRAQSIHDAL